MFFSGAFSWRSLSVLWKSWSYFCQENCGPMRTKVFMKRFILSFPVPCSSLLVPLNKRLTIEHVSWRSRWSHPDIIIECKPLAVLWGQTSHTPLLEQLTGQKCVTNRWFIAWSTTLKFLAYPYRFNLGEPTIRTRNLRWDLGERFLSRPAIKVS